MCVWINIFSFNIDYIFVNVFFFDFFEFFFVFRFWVSIILNFFCDFKLHLESWCLVVEILSFPNQSFLNFWCTHLISFDNPSKISLISFSKMLNYFWQNVTSKHIKFSKHGAFGQQVESIICYINLHNSLIT
jgi:hypothetical protein